ncbi:MAG TPA: hypothetical protein VGK58_17595 [Lacipirellulaceae bacterium]
MFQSLLRWIFAVGCVAALAYGSAVLWGRGARASFSPDTLDYRTQRELLLPLIGVPIYRSRYRVHRNNLAQFLIDNNYWSPQQTDSPRWILANHWNDQWKDGFTGFHREFTSQKQFWIAWSKAHPERAAEFWPELLSLIRKSDYDDSAVTEAMWNVKVSLGDEYAELRRLK